MTICESDFKIIGDYHNYTLYLLKGVKCTSDDKFKIGGYFLNIESALKAVLRFRKNKKYFGNESHYELSKKLKDIITTRSDLDNIINKIYNPINLKNKI